MTIRYYSDECEKPHSEGIDDGAACANLDDIFY